MVARRLTAGRVAITALVALAVLAAALPFAHVIALSLSSNSAILRGAVGLLPVEPTLMFYGEALGDITILRSLLVTIQVSVIYTVLALAMTITGAYPLSKRRLAGRGFFLMLILITMYFSGGLIPQYLLVRSLGMLNTTWSLIFPILISAFNLIILKTFFESVPTEMEDSAYIDGASEATTLLRIYLPLSKPVLATLALFYAVARWNTFQDALFYINEPKIYPLQMKLSFLVLNASARAIMEQERGQGIADFVAEEGIKAATIMVATVPILLVYPWLQRYFIRGVMIGAIKG